MYVSFFLSLVSSRFSFVFSDWMTQLFNQPFLMHMNEVEFISPKICMHNILHFFFFVVVVVLISAHRNVIVQLYASIYVCMYGYGQIMDYKCINEIYVDFNTGWSVHLSQSPLFLSLHRPTILFQFLGWMRLHCMCVKYALCLCLRFQCFLFICSGCSWSYWTHKDSHPKTDYSNRRKKIYII